MGLTWRDCIVTMIDLVGTKDKARGGRGSALMHNLHGLVIRSKPDLPSVQKAYTWNDSVLLLSFVTASVASYAAAMSDAHLMKHRVDKLESASRWPLRAKLFLLRQNTIRP